MQHTPQGKGETMTPRLRKAVIPAAGLGTRFLPATKVVPKELMPVVDRPAIQYAVEEALAAGVEEIIFVLSPGKESVLRHFQPHPELESALLAKNKLDMLAAVTNLHTKARYSMVIQDKPLGLGHAVACAREAVGDEWFYVFLPDDVLVGTPPVAEQMRRAWEQNPQAMLAVMEVAWEHVSQYGIIEGRPLDKRLGEVISVVEKPERSQAPSNVAIVGRYILPPVIFERLAATQAGSGGEIQLTDALRSLLPTPGLHAFLFDGRRFDTGNKQGFLEANIEMALLDPDLGPWLKAWRTVA
jgi:UTP--glucose-1-phosphate uridylyltransferase